MTANDSQWLPTLHHHKPIKSFIRVALRFEEFGNNARSEAISLEQDSVFDRDVNFLSKNRSRKLGTAIGRLHPFFRLHPLPATHSLTGQGNHE